MEETTEPPSGSLLEKLPLHLLYLISECLSQLQPRSRRSIFALSLANKSCYEATELERFRHIRIALAGHQKLQQDTQYWRQILRTGHRQRFVHSVKITSVKTPSSVEEEQIKQGDVSCSTLRNSIADEEVPELFSGLDKSTCGNYLGPRPSATLPDESAWKPLVDLISDLPALQDVVFTFGNQFPRLLLSELHDHHPHCRLHMHCFKLRSLIHPELEEQKIHPDDIALATSPSLCSIVVQTQPYHCAQTLDYNEEAVMAMAKGAAPNLKNVSLTEGHHQSAPGVFATIPRPPWKGFQIPAERRDGERSPMGRLEHLVFNKTMGGEQLLQWSYCTDFRHLRSIKAGPGFDVSAVRQFAEISRQTPLRALSSLNLTVFSYDSVYESYSLIDAAVAELLQSLCPLEVLELGGRIGEESFEAIMTHHTERLRKLTFTCHDRETELFKFPPERAAQLSRECPRLKEVDVREPKFVENTGFFYFSD